MIGGEITVALYCTILLCYNGAQAVSLLHRNISENTTNGVLLVQSQQWTMWAVF